jgi:broad specificity phosphatase PhoE
MAVVLLLRHTAIAARHRGRCYGRLDVGLGREGRAAARALAAAALPIAPALVVASPLRRARVLAGLIARRHGLRLAIDPRLGERDHGTWEGRRWDAIWQDTGNAMDRMITEPDSFRPGGGETTEELAARAAAWLAGAPDGVAIVAVSHAGPIGALVGRLAGRPVADWHALAPQPGHGWLIATGGDGALLRRWPSP